MIDVWQLMWDQSATCQMDAITRFTPPPPPQHFFSTNIPYIFSPTGTPRKKRGRGWQPTFLRQLLHGTGTDRCFAPSLLDIFIVALV